MAHLCLLMLLMPAKQHSPRPTIPWLFFSLQISKQHVSPVNIWGLPDPRATYGELPDPRTGPPTSVWEPPTWKAPAATRPLPALCALQPEGKRECQGWQNAKQPNGWKDRNGAQASCEEAQCSPQSHSPWIEATITEGVVKKHPLQHSYFNLRQKSMFGVRGPHNFQPCEKVQPRTISWVPNF